jgi:hypothetical protein
MEFHMIEAIQAYPLGAAMLTVLVAVFGVLLGQLYLLYEDFFFWATRAYKLPHGGALRRTVRGVSVASWAAIVLVSLWAVGFIKVSFA